MKEQSQNGGGEADNKKDQKKEEASPPWNQPLPEFIPEPTVYPAVLAFGACFLVMGILTSWMLSVVGGVFFAFGCAGWVRELCKAHP